MLNPFTPAGDTVNLAVTAASASVALTQAPSQSVDLTIVLANAGPDAAFIKFGDATVVATAGAGHPIQPGSTQLFSVNATRWTHLAAITGSGTATLYATSGTGIPYGFGAGGASGGGGASEVMIVDGNGDPLVYNPNGQATMANSSPVVISSNQTDLPVNIESTNGNALVNDDAAAGTTAPVPVGGIYNSALPSYTAGDRTQVQLTARGSLRSLVTGVSVGGTSGITNSVIYGLADSSATAAQPLVMHSLVLNSAGTLDQQRGNTVGTIVIPPLGWQYAAATGGITGSTAAVTIKASAGAGLRNYLSSIQICTDVLGTATEIAVRDGAGGTVLWRMKLQTITALPVTTMSFLNPLVGSVATLLEVVTLTASTGGVYFNAQGYAAP